MSLGWIRRCVLEAIRKTIFHFYYFGNSKNNGMVWIRWQELALQKVQCGWGRKDPTIFMSSHSEIYEWFRRINPFVQFEIFLLPNV